MKKLSDYIKKSQTKLLEKYNAFFAFSTEQFDEAKKKGLKYVSRGAGLYHEAGKTKEFDREWNNIIAEGIKQDLKENGKEKIIERALNNYECYYMGETEEAVESLIDYGITRKEVKEIYNKNVDKYHLLF